MVFIRQKVFTNTIFYQILVFGDTNISIKIIFGLFLGIFGRTEKQKAGFCPLLCLLMNQYCAYEVAELADTFLA